MMQYKKTAAAYIRVSTDDQAELSPDSQLVEIRKYAEREGYLLPDEHIYSDEGISGKKADKRPGFQKMIATAKEEKGAFDVILVWKFSRFARNQEESIFYKSILRNKCNVDVISISEPLADGPFGGLIERIIEWMDEFYSLRLSQEVKRSMTLNAEKGVRQTAASFGYRLENGKMVPDEIEAPIVRRIFEDFVNGKGLYPIARELNAQGITTHRGGAFENRTIEYILRNPVYIGKHRWNPTGRTRRKFDDPNIIVADGDHEPIIDIGLWDAAQAQMAEVKARWSYKAKPTYNAKFWLQGIVRCATCGSTLIWSNPCYVKCNNYSRGRCATSQHTQAEIIQAAVLEKMEADAAGGTDLAFDVVYKASGENNSRAVAVKALEHARGRLARLKDAYLNGVIELDEFARTKKELEQAVAKAEGDIAAADKSADRNTLITNLRADIARTVADIKSPEKTLDEKNSAAKALIESCIYDKNAAIIELTYRIII